MCECVCGRVLRGHGRARDYGCYGCGCYGHAYGCYGDCERDHYESDRVSGHDESDRVDDYGYRCCGCEYEKKEKGKVCIDWKQ